MHTLLQTGQVNVYFPTLLIAKNRDGKDCAETPLQSKIENNLKISVKFRNFDLNTLKIRIRELQKQ